MMDKADFYAYTHTDLNGRVFYVGKGCNRRAYETYGRTKAWNEAAEKGFEVTIVADNKTDKDAREIESSLIRQHSETIVNVRTRDNSPLKESAKKVISAVLPHELVDRLDDFMERQEFKPARSVVVEVALRDYLDQNESHSC